MSPLGVNFRSLISHAIPREPQWKRRESRWWAFVWGQISIRYGRNISSQIITFHPFSSSSSFHSNAFKCSRGHSHQNSLFLSGSCGPKTTVNCSGRRFHVVLFSSFFSKSKDHDNRHDATIMGVSRYFPIIHVRFGCRQCGLIWINFNLLLCRPVTY